MLNGIKVLDLSRVLAGPVCTMMLGDMGAGVIKVERRPMGDETRGWGPPFDDRGESAYFLSVNRNKLSLAADLDLPEDRALVERLIAEADVVVDNFRPGSLERRGIDRRRIVEEHRQLIWCTIAGFDRSNGADRPGYDFVVQAECGWMSVTGPIEGPPMKIGMALADVITGKDAAIAILGALVARGRDGRGSGRGSGRGRGRQIELSLDRSATAALINVAQNALVTGAEPRRWGNAHPNLVPYQLFDTADRPIVVAVGSDPQWRTCARALGLDGLADDPRYAANAGRVAHREALVATLAGRLKERPSAEWLSALERSGVPCGVVKTVLEALSAVDASPLTGIAPSIPGTVRLPPPRLDEHGAEIRRRGWDVFA